MTNTTCAKKKMCNVITEAIKQGMAQCSGFFRKPKKMMVAFEVNNNYVISGV